MWKIALLFAEADEGGGARHDGNEIKRRDQELAPSAVVRSAAAFQHGQKEQKSEDAGNDTKDALHSFLFELSGGEKGMRQKKEHQRGQDEK